MGVSDLDRDAHGRRLWNAGNMISAKRPLKARDVWAIRFFSMSTGDCAIARCSIWQSITNCRLAIS